MKFSLVTGTLGRADVLTRLLKSLQAQTHQNFELIIVDQNEDDRVRGVLDPFRDAIDLRHLQIEGNGLSRARNRGLEYATGDIIGFPDDDCWYPDALLEEVSEFFSENPGWDGLTGRVVDETGTPSFGRWDSGEGVVTKRNCWTRSNSNTIFLRSKVAESVGNFDEKIGVGAETPWGAGEEMDYLIRSIDKGFRIWYNEKITVGHPKEQQKELKKAHKYAMGMGKVFTKNNVSSLTMVKFLMRSIAGTLLNIIKLNVRKAKFHKTTFEGRVKGWMCGGEKN